MKVLNANVLIRVIEEENVHQGTGLDLSMETIKNEKFRKGEVVDFGELIPRIENVPILGGGDHVLFDISRSSDLTIEGIAYKIVMYGDIQVVF